jgi:hypothetical protein
MPVLDNQVTSCVMRVFYLDIATNICAIVKVIGSRLIGHIAKVHSYCNLSTHSLSLFRYHLVII